MPTTRRAFTLVELLIVIAINTILAGLALAGLRMVKGSAQEAACRSNQRQIGLAISAYSTDNRGYIPPAILVGHNPGIPHWGKWFGFLEPYVPEFSNSPVFMCPSWIRRSDTEKMPNFALHNLYSVSYGYSYWTQVVVLGRDQWRWKMNLDASAQTALLAEHWGVDSTGQFNSEPAVQPNWCGNGARAAFGDHPMAPTDPGAGEASQRFSHKRRCNVLFYDLHVAAVTLQDSGINQHDTPNIWEGR